ncbi:FKBP-type peptidyl-prolyl cis-trans isomerase 1 [Pseudomonas savastanoi pv. glycinea]|uniref:Peptidyl-prolyl cis-trans isomerase n=3 Tax=Pseudomonas savastanoi pv. glycinea TaxID=318 RepID=A0A3M3HR38_PSESG|nr:Peptidyl-prolyl cis-trans isomerase [Pseudomonas savastanoi pv. glycinea]RMN00685.1 Peptidyl-prolyl cis-trans isomerase [Pseudomonas savastanoi pv. glycinea]RMO27353.1 Peptidyl-prolyl cis-trans isomerase [Pseudomonas savastanoi pv. glycinea]RMO27377.1 Peptidyl-prolyl cis-trans isomerase [Pseudomonas savastanoi pv. glycinea]RMO48932.1 FKBP-type peptidyl-prolyl cis-trans isomerase 1 [Pseudomonas savastanoi pv. glycinea]
MLFCEKALRKCTLSAFIERAKNGSLVMSKQLQITDLHPGEGKEAVKGALITTHYTGTLEDGTVFDSSHQRGKPFQCVIGTGRVIKGWDQGLMGMKVGGKRKLFVPAHLAYGDRTMGAHIKPGADLTFEIELLEVLTRDD